MTLAFNLEFKDQSMIVAFLADLEDATGKRGDEAKEAVEPIIYEALENFISQHKRRVLSQQVKDKYKDRKPPKAQTPVK